MTSIRRLHRLSQHVWPRSRPPRPLDYALLEQIRSQASQFDSLSDSQLQVRALELRNAVDGGQPLLHERTLVTAFALVKQAVRRTLDQQPFDVQVLAGLAMSLGNIAEMQTGEGKTLASLFPAFLFALAGRGVHVATVNRYLAQRDFAQLRSVYELLGLQVGLAADGTTPPQKRVAYACDVTYATGYELGFDYLRDQLALKTQRREPLGSAIRHGLRGDTGQLSGVVQRGHAVAIIDEVDSVLLDEAATPLVISSCDSDSRPADQACEAARQLADGMLEDRDFVISPAGRGLHLTQQGLSRLYENSTTDSATAPEPPAVAGRRTLLRPWSVYVEQALRRKHLLQRDVHYVVRGGRLELVDEYTGRILEDRNWRDGLHQAVEAKEGLLVTAEKRSLARISRQRFFQLYDRLCGMTGTATGHEAELYRVYGLPIVVIPLRKPSRRQQMPTRYFASVEQKWEAIVQEVVSRHRSGRPVLVGSRTIENSRLLAQRLQDAGVPFRLLNGVQDEDEASLVARAGEAKAVTIATNMAGRGTDIRLTGPTRAAGGLHVVAVERHDSRRIDRQLLGRAGRQGDPGSGQFFVAADDELLQRYSPSFARRLQHAVDDQHDWAYDRRVSRLQSVAERANFQRRREAMREELWLQEINASLS